MKYDHKLLQLSPQQLFQLFLSQHYQYTSPRFQSQIVCTLHMSAACINITPVYGVLHVKFGHLACVLNSDTPTFARCFRPLRVLTPRRRCMHAHPHVLLHRAFDQQCARRRWTRVHLVRKRMQCRSTAQSYCHSLVLL